MRADGGFRRKANCQDPQAGACLREEGKTCRKEPWEAFTLRAACRDGYALPRFARGLAKHPPRVGRRRPG